MENIKQTMILSIRPEYVQKIFQGNKIFEYRKVTCRKSIRRILIYATNPVKAIVGEAELKSVRIGTPEQLWEETGYGAGVKKDDYDRYWAGKEQGVAYELSHVQVYQKPRTLEEYGIVRAPQSFQYL